jgi:hypothetical protein
MCKPLLTSLSLSLLLPLAAFMNTASSEGFRQFEFTVLILDPTTGSPQRTQARRDPLHYEYAGETVRLHASVGASSQHYRYNGPIPVIFYREETRLNEEGEEEIVRIPLAVIRNIPARAERLLFILVPLADGRYANHVVDYSHHVLRPGHVMVANLSAAEVAFTVSDDSPKVIVSGGVAVARRHAVGRYRFFMRLASRNGSEDWQLIDSGFHLAAPESRQLFLVHRYNHQRKWNVQRIHALDAIVPVEDEAVDDLTEQRGDGTNRQPQTPRLSEEEQRELEQLDSRPQFF